MPTYLNGAHSALLPPMRLVSRTTQEYAGACPFCGGDHRRSDRFHVWLTPGTRPRYWCRRCGRKGPVQDLLDSPRIALSISPDPLPRQTPGPRPVAAHIPLYRQIYAAVAAWAQANLVMPANPDPLAFLQRRGLARQTIAHARLGYALHDPLALRTHLEQQHPDLLPYAEEAGVLIRDRTGTLRTHWNLCGCLVFPYRATGLTVDLRTRTCPGRGYRSLPGSYASRGAVFPYGWETLGHADTVLITEGEIKQLAVRQAYHAGLFPLPALAHPGLTYFRRTWALDVLRRGVRLVVLGYDTQPRPVVDGRVSLAPEEIWTLRHGWTFAQAGLQVLVIRLPLMPGTTSIDLDAFLLHAGPQALTALLDTALPLRDYYRSLPTDIVRATPMALPHRYAL